MTLPIHNIINEVERLPDHAIYGRVTGIVGLLVEIGGVQGVLSIGDHCAVEGRNGKKVICEVVGFRNDRALVMPFGSLDGIGLGCRAEVGAHDPAIHPSRGWLGRVVNAFGEPVDGKGPLPNGPTVYPVQIGRAHV